jgi:hypothetical protein
LGILTTRVTSGTAEPDAVSWRELARRNWIQVMAGYLAIRGIGVIYLWRLGSAHGDSLHSLLTKWDGQWMLALAHYGFNGVPATYVDGYGIHTSNTAYAFFPGYPWLVTAVASLPGVDDYAAAIASNLILGALGALAAARLAGFCVRSRGGSQELQNRTGLLTAALFSAAPMGIVLSMAYTEALYCALAGWALVALLERHWLAASALTILAGFSRTTSLALIAVFGLTALMHWRDGWRVWLATILAPLGWLATILIVAAHAGSLTAWFTIQREGWNTTFDFGRASFEYVNNVLGASDSAADVITAWIMVITVLLVGVAFWKRLPWEVSLYGALVVISVIGSSGLMASRARLLLPAYVLLIPVAMGLAGRARSTQWSVIAAVPAMSTWFGAYMLVVFPYAM